MQGIVVSFINKQRYGDCEGCRQGFPSQRDHECLVEDAEFHVNRYFIRAFDMISPQLMRSICAFYGKSFPSLDCNVYKTTHKEALRNGLEDIVDGIKSNNFIEFYDCMKCFI